MAKIYSLSQKYIWFNSGVQDWKKNRIKEKNVPKRPKRWRNCRDDYYWLGVTAARANEIYERMLKNGGAI